MLDVFSYNKCMNINKLSKDYRIRKLTEADTDIIFDLCKDNKDPAVQQLYRLSADRGIESGSVTGLWASLF